MDAQRGTAAEGGSGRRRLPVPLALALLLAFAVPASIAAWQHGVHATPEQARLHDRAIADGHAHHHATHGTRASELRAAAGTTVCAAEGSGSFVSQVQPAFSPDALGVTVLLETLHGLAVVSGDGAGAAPSMPRALPMAEGAEQCVTRPPLPPPISL